MHITFKVSAQIENIFLKILTVLEENLTIIFKDFSNRQLPVCLQTNHQFCTMYRGR